MRKFVARSFLTLLVVLVICITSIGVYVYRAFHASLPELDGVVSAAGLAAPVKIERDADGVPTIHAAHIRDRAYAIGFLHGQDRFFQMDGLRRIAAGELSELFGPPTLAVDQRNRLHQFRERAKNVVQAGTEEEQELLDRYAAGVNAGLKHLGARPFEYSLILGVDPRPWSPEDTILVIFAMYLDLQGADFRKEKARHTVYETLPRKLADFLCPKGCEEWDAPIVGDPIPLPPVPASDVIDLRAKTSNLIPDRSTADEHDGVKLGSNNWAVAGAHTKHGGAIVANDMHLGLRVPNIWYRASFVIPAVANPTQSEMVATGVTLPGAPAIVVGSNGHVAWGFTNSEGDWSDLVILDIDPADSKRYLTPDGTREIETVEETVLVRGSQPHTLTVERTIWGPVVGKDVHGRPLALRWVAHDIAGVNMRSAKAMEQTNLDDAIAFAARCGNPAQNFTAADRSGRIGWTIMGRIPDREGFDGWLPCRWSDGTNRWSGYLDPANYPKVVDPESGRIWTANARVVSGEMLEKVGHGGYDLGARQKQIRDQLLKIEEATEEDMLTVALDDRAVFWVRWQNHLLELLDEESVQENPLRREARDYLTKWGGRAATDSIGFRIVRDYQVEVKGRILEWLTNPCRAADPDFKCADLPRSVEGSISTIVLSPDRPAHLLDPSYSSWDEFLIESIDRVLSTATNGGRSLSEHTWGNYNTLTIRHPMSDAMREAAGGSWLDSILALDMPSVAVSGASRNMPKILRPKSGASQRLAVSPGREAEGYFHMPGGQSGQPMSPFYRAGHDDWVEGRFRPFLPGPTVHTLVLEPGRTGP